LPTELLVAIVALRLAVQYGMVVSLWISRGAAIG
jgi:hypothetical protein